MESRWDRFQRITAKRTEGSTHWASAVMVDTAKFGTYSVITSILQAQIVSARVNSKSRMRQLYHFSVTLSLSSQRYFPQSSPLVTRSIPCGAYVGLFRELPARQHVKSSQFRVSGSLAQGIAANCPAHGHTRSLLLLHCLLSKAICYSLARDCAAPDFTTHHTAPQPHLDARLRCTPTMERTYGLATRSRAGRVVKKRASGQLAHVSASCWIR